MVREREARRLLVRHVWPDKLLYGSIMLTIAGLLGLIHAVIASIVPVAVGATLPILEFYPLWLMVLLSFVTLVCGLLALRRLSVAWGLVGAAAGIASLSLFGIGSVHAGLALLFVLLAVREGEHRTPETARLTKLDWPDKALAASLLLLMAGIAAVAWGLGVLIDVIAWNIGPPLVWGALQLLAGIVGVVASAYLYNERGALLGVVAAALLTVTLAAYFLAPGLALAGLVAIALAWREGEFRATPASPAEAARPRRSA